MIARGEPRSPILVVDPGKKVGLCRYNPALNRHDAPEYVVWSCNLSELPGALYGQFHGMRTAGGGVRFMAPTLVACESFILTGGSHANAGATDMPASQGIGMCRQAVYGTGADLLLLHRNCKRAGAAALDTYGRAARAAAKNEHQRDAVDLCGYVLRQMRLPQGA